MNISFVKIVLKNNHYSRTESNNISLEDFGFLLAYVDNRKECLNQLYNGTCDAIGVETIWADKVDDLIVISDSRSEEEDGGPFLYIHLDEFARIINEWDEFCKKHGKEMLITMENDKITLTPTY